MLNKVSLIGHVGKEPNIRAMNNGKEVATFSIATTESWTDKQTCERQSKTEWHRVVVFSQGIVGIIKKYVHKGSKLYIEGSLKTRKWTDSNGVEKYVTEVIMNGFNCCLEMLTSKNSQSNDSSNSNDQNNSNDQQDDSCNQGGDFMDESIQF